LDLRRAAAKRGQKTSVRCGRAAGLRLDVVLDNALLLFGDDGGGGDTGNRRKGGVFASLVELVLVTLPAEKREGHVFAIEEKTVWRFGE